MKIYKKKLGISTKILNKRTPNYVIVFIASLLIVLVIFVLLSLVFTKTHIVKANGTIISPDTVYIASNVSGKVNEIYYAEKDSVQNEDNILSLDDGALHNKIDTLNKNKEELENTLQSIDLFVQSVKQGANLLSPEIHSRVYNEKINYFINLTNETYNNINLQNQIKEKRLSKINEINNEIINDIELNEEQIDAKQIEIQQLEEEILSIEGNIRTYTSQLDQVSSQMLIEAENEKKEVKSKLLEIEYSISQEQNGLDALKITANHNGILHYLIDVKKGTFINSGQTIASITPKNKNYEIECFVDVSDRTKIPKDGFCNIRITGVNSSQFGTLRGKIRSISDDIVNKENQGIIKPYYRVLVTIDKTDLDKLENNGTTVQLSLPVSVEFIYDEETYFVWFIELITSINK